jgi:hypothetical protein
MQILNENTTEIITRRAFATQACWRQLQFKFAHLVLSFSFVSRLLVNGKENIQL